MSEMLQFERQRDQYRKSCARFIFKGIYFARLFLNQLPRDGARCKSKTRLGRKRNFALSDISLGFWLGDNRQWLSVSGDNCQCRQLSVGTTVSGTTVSGPWTTVRRNCQCSEKTVRSYSCPKWVQLLFISGSSSPGAVFFSYWIWAQGQRLVEWG